MPAIAPEPYWKKKCWQHTAFFAGVVFVEFKLVTEFLLPVREFLRGTTGYELSVLSRWVLEAGAFQQTIHGFLIYAVLIVGSILLLWKSKAHIFARFWMTALTLIFVAFSIIMVTTLLNPYFAYIRENPEKGPMSPIKMEIKVQNSGSDS